VDNVHKKDEVFGSSDETDVLTDRGNDELSSDSITIEELDGS
jgi:hypothetical protein